LTIILLFEEIFLFF